MKIEETYTRQVTYVKDVLCDKCSTTIETDIFERFECTLVREEGFVYPEGGDYVRESIDLCGACSRELFDRLAQEGYHISRKEIDV